MDKNAYKGIICTALHGKKVSLIVNKCMTISVDKIKYYMSFEDYLLTEDFHSIILCENVGYRNPSLCILLYV
jgi:hypothetical protein